MGDELRTEHCFRVLPHLVGTARELDAARLAATAGVHLGFDDPQVAAEFFGCRHGSVGRLDRDAARHRDAVIGKKSFRLVFVQIHWIVGVVVITGRRIL